MGLLAPWFLAAIAALGLPVWLHMLRKHQSVPKPFSSLMFFERRPQSSIKHRRLRYLSLLLLRLALLAMLIFAFANPYIKRSIAAGGGKKLLVLAIDNSFSMRYGDRLAKAKQQAANALGRLNPGDVGQVISVSNQVQLLTAATDNSADLRAAIAAIQPSDANSSFGEFSRFLRTTAQQLHLPIEVHFASDMQKSSMPPSFADVRLAPGTSLILHPADEKPAPNWAVETVTAPRSLYEPKKARIQVTIAGYGTEAARRNVVLSLNGKTQATKTVDVPAGGRASVEFISLDSATYGFNRGEVRIEPGDTLPQDDRFLFAVERADPRKILFVHEARDQRSVLYFKTALEAAAEPAFDLEPINVDQTASILPTKYAFVVLSNVGRIPAAFEDSLRRYVTGGGSVLVALGPASAGESKIPIAEEAIVESHYAAREGDRFQTATVIDPAHPSVSRSAGLEGVRFYQITRFRTAKSHVIARLDDQTPVLAEKQVGEGKVLMFASTFDNIANDFPLHASFVPFVDRSAGYLGGIDQRSANIPVGSHISLHNSKDRGTAVEVIDPEGKRPLTLKEAAAAESFAVNREGYYEIRRTNGRQEMLAVHADRRESDLAPLPAETLALWKNSGSGDTSPSDASSETGERTTKWSLGPYLVILLLLVALAESLVADRYLSVAREDETVVRREAA